MHGSQGSGIQVASKVRLRSPVPAIRGVWRRWAIVLAGTVALGCIPGVVAALPVSGSTVSAAALRAKIAGSARVPYEGYAETTANFGLPQLPDLQNVSTLLDGTTDQYVWYRSPAYWRAEDATALTGETDTYTDGGVTYLWDYGRGLLTQVIGAQPVRLPRPDDLLPPPLARRLLDIAGTAARFTRLPARRVAGVNAAGLQVIPAEASTTIAAIDIWADPRTGLPVEVQLTARGSAAPVLTSTFLEFSGRQPALGTVTPHPAPQVGITTTRLPDVDSVLNGDGDGDGDHTPFPAALGGQPRVPLPGSPPGLAVYGTGLSRFVLLPLPRGEGSAAYSAAVSAGADLVTLGSQSGTAPPGGNPTGAVIRTPLLSVLLVTAGFHHTTFVFAGAVSPTLLENSANDFVSDLANRFRRPR
jgi:hypothetical protein